MFKDEIKKNYLKKKDPKKKPMSTHVNIKKTKK
jgi:hypothetical protein